MRTCKNCGCDISRLSKKKKFCDILCAYDHLDKYKKRIAEEVRKPENDKKTRKMRACLGVICRGKKMFKSDHRFHRICSRCSGIIRGIETINTSLSNIFKNK